MTHPESRKRSAFTVFELLTIIAIIAILIALLLPAIQKVREAASRTQCQSQMRQIGIALHTSQDAYNQMPPHCGKYFFPAGFAMNNTKGKEFLGTAPFWLLAFTDQANQVALFDVMDGEEKSANTWHNGIAGKKFAAPKLYVCPADPNHIVDGTVGGEPATSYAYNLSIFAAGQGKVKVPASVTDGAASTVMVFERYGKCADTRTNPWGKADVGGANLYGKSEWIKEAMYTVDGKNPASAKNHFKPFQHLPRPNECDPYTAQSIHSAGLNALMADASVHMVSPAVTSTTWHAVITPNANDLVGPDW